MSNLYPLFDAGFLLWKSEVAELLRDHFGDGLERLGLSERRLQAHYYAGRSALSMIDPPSFFLPDAAE